MLTHSKLKEALHYDPSTGDFTWLKSRGRVAAGQVAGAKHCEGYTRIKLNGVDYLAHRLAFLYMTGVWPEFEVDHANGVRNDNRWENLRDLTHQHNMFNQANTGSAVGVMGVIKVSSTGRFRAAIKLNGKVKYLGSFAELWEAHAAYLRAKDEMHPTHRRL